MTQVWEGKTVDIVVGICLLLFPFLLAGMFLAVSRIETEDGGFGPIPPGGVHGLDLFGGKRGADRTPWTSACGGAGGGSAP